MVDSNEIDNDNTTDADMIDTEVIDMPTPTPSTPPKPKLNEA